MAELLAHEGYEVQAGQPLVRLHSQRITARGDTAVLTAQALVTRHASLDTDVRRTVAGCGNGSRSWAMSSGQKNLRDETNPAREDVWDCTDAESPPAKVVTF